MKKIDTTYIPINPMKKEPIVKPTMTVNTPKRKSKGDSAETKTFNIQKIGAGQRSRTKIKMLIRADRQPKTVARI